MFSTLTLGRKGIGLFHIEDVLEVVAGEFLYRLSRSTGALDSVSLLTTILRAPDCLGIHPVV